MINQIKNLNFLQLKKNLKMNILLNKLTNHKDNSKTTIIIEKRIILKSTINKKITKMKNMLKKLMIKIIDFN